MPVLWRRGEVKWECSLLMTSLYDNLPQQANKAICHKLHPGPQEVTLKKKKELAQSVVDENNIEVLNSRWISDSPHKEEGTEREMIGLKKEPYK